MRWYEANGFDFIVATEHELVFADNAVARDPSKFLVIPGQEITQETKDSSIKAGFRSGHVNGINIHTAIMPVMKPVAGDKQSLTDAEFYNRRRLVDTSMRALFERNVGEVLKQGGLPQINHPNFGWSVKATDLKGLKGPYLLEIWSGFDWANSLGGRTPDGAVQPSTEQLWDTLLSAGAVVYGTAADDAHYYAEWDRRGPKGRPAHHVLTPGKTWIRVKAQALTVDTIMRAMRQGDFYASNGVDLLDVRREAGSLAVDIEDQNYFWPENAASYRTVFSGRDGKVLAEVYGSTAEYRFKGDEGYVRATVTDSNGRMAWVQPVFLDGRTTTSP